jgi:putative flavoprotein involved in K+ transport
MLVRSSPATVGGVSVSDCVVVGAGPAGLAASAALSEHGVDHLLLERGRVGETWRTQRWDSFRLNSPGWANRVLGEEAPYATGPEVVELLEGLAADRPIREGTAVLGLGRAGGGFALHTSDGDVRSRSVVIATGDENVPKVLALTGMFPEWIAQYHAADYRAPGQLPIGTVLVVGSAQSGGQIAQDLVAAGRKVVLATSSVGRAPMPYRGRDTLEWLAEAGFFDQRPQDLPDPSLMREPPPLVAPGGRSLSLQALARAGVTLAGRLVEVTREQAIFDGSAKANVAAGDAFAARARAMIDEMILRLGLDAPPAEPDEADAPADLDPPLTLDLRAHEVSSVVWCTGFTGDFSWLDPGLVDGDGLPRREDAAAIAPGIWYMGLRWLIRRGSGVFYGFPGDAAVVAEAVRAYLGRSTLRRQNSGHGLGRSR